MSENKQRLLIERAEDIQGFLDRIGVTEMRSNSDAFNQLLNNTSFDDLKKFIIFLNAKIRNIPSSDGGIHNGIMYAGTLIAPNISIKMCMFEKGFNAIKSIKNNKQRATLAYYLLNDLHLFNDANGRTARLIYEILNNDKFDMKESYINIMHSESNASLIKNGHKGFEEANGIISTIQANGIAGQLLFKELYKNSEIFNDSRIIKEVLITRGGEIQNYNCIYIPDEIKEKLNQDEIYQINYALLDNNSTYSVSGIAMAIMQTKKGTMQRCVKINEGHIAFVLSKFGAEGKARAKSFIFDVNDSFGTEDFKVIFDGWTLDDYREIVNIANRVKKEQMEILIDIFSNPERYMIENNQILNMIKSGESK